MTNVQFSRAAFIAILLGSTAACSRPERTSTEDVSTYDVESPREMGSAPGISPNGPRSAVEAPPAMRTAPGIVPTAAPGVAFSYNYGFRLPDDRVSAAQEAHAAACEKLGLNRCRITGMTYEMDEYERVQGSLVISIDPLVARGFGKEAIAEVERQEGKLRYARIDGVDQNPVLDEAARRQGNANSEITKLEADMAKARSENERVQIREQIRQLRAQIANAKEQATSAEARIQRTPMSFTYLGGDASGRGFAGENPAKDAWYMFVDSLAMMISIVLKGIAILLPWAAALTLIIALGRSRLFTPLRRWWRGEGKGEDPAS